MSVDIEQAKKIAKLMNQAVACDLQATAALLANRVPCRGALAIHPTIQVTPQHGGHFVGLLGILNGIVGCYDHGGGPIVAIFDDETPAGEHYPPLLGFGVRGRDCQKIDLGDDV